MSPLAKGANRMALQIEAELHERKFDCPESALKATMKSAANHGLSDDDDVRFNAAIFSAAFFMADDDAAIKKLKSSVEALRVLYGILAGEIPRGECAKFDGVEIWPLQKMWIEAKAGAL